MIDEKTFSDAKQAIFEFNTVNALEIVRKVIDGGGNPLELMDSSFIPAINEIGEQFSIGRMFLPELVQAAETMKAVTDLITETLPKDTAASKERSIVIGTVQGDIHDIGKTLVVTLLAVNGFEVHDLGRDVSVESFIDKAVEIKADIIGTSSLLTTTMTEQKELEKALKEAGLKGKFKTIVGGAPVTQRWADRIGADAYAENAHEGVVKAKELVGR